MSESLLEIRHRISTIQATEKLTKAMKLVASVKFQKWKRYFDDDKDYEKTMHDTMKRTLQSVAQKDIKAIPCLNHFSDKKDLYIIVSSSLGLCGSYNYNLFNLADSLIKPEDELILIGQKAYLHYKNYPNKRYDDYLNLMNDFSFDAVKNLRHFCFRLYRTKTYHSVSLIYTIYKNSIMYTPAVKQLLPFDLTKLQLEENKPAYPPLFDPNVKEVLQLILPHYIDSSLYNKLIMSTVAEQASRRNAMETATDSANKIIADLKLKYNRLRQASITQEITEVVAGANNNN